MSHLADIEVAIGPAKAAGKGSPSLHNVEVRVDGAGPWKYETAFDLDSLDPTRPQEYGTALGQQFTKPALLRALDQAGFTRGKHIRLRLVLDDGETAPHWVRWERMWLPLAGETEYVPVATHARVAFSRHIRVEQPDTEPPDAEFFKLLVAFANPTGLDADQQIDVSAEIASLLEEFESGPGDQRLKVSILPGRSGVRDDVRARLEKRGWTLIEDGRRPERQTSSVRQISNELSKQFHGLHIVAHGEFDPDGERGVLLLENADGGKELVDHTALQSWLTASLQLIVMQACQGGATTAEGRSPFTSLAPRLVGLGLPSAVAMQDYVEMKDARAFFAVFYRRLLDEGRVDVAVNDARQVLRDNSDRDNWSIPALFSHLRSGSLWRPDRLRASLIEAFAQLPDAEMDPWPEMLQVIEHTRGAAKYDPMEGAAGPRFNLWDRLVTCARRPGSLTILTGARGAYKSAHLRRVFRDHGSTYRNATGSGPLPVLLTLADLTADRSEIWPAFSRIWSGRTTDFEAESKALQGRPLLFLIDAEQELPGPRGQEAVRAIDRLQKALPHCSILLAVDEPVLPTLVNAFDTATLLVSQPLDSAQIMAYFAARTGDGSEPLAKNIRERGYGDLAGQPRFLQHMIDLSARRKALPSRRVVLELITEIYLARLTAHDVPRACVEEAIEQIAWHIQSGRGVALDGGQVATILGAARDGRELGIRALRHALVNECRLLLPSGDEGLRFAYGVLQSYFAARFIAKARDRDRLIEDITASLGRLARARRWERVLVLLGSMLPQPGDLLGAILAGSSLMEGEQLFLAVSCYQEAHHAHASSDAAVSDLAPVTHQMVDALIWRSTWDPGRPYADRRKALDSLVGLGRVLAGTENWRDDIIAHLVAVACDPVPDQDNPQPESVKPLYDFAGMRQGAANGLLALYEQADVFVQNHRRDLVDLLKAWSELRLGSDGMRAILRKDDPGSSVIAAFALAESGRSDDRTFLVESYENVRDDDVRWGIVNALSIMDAAWLRQFVIGPWMAWKDEWKSSPRAVHTCYLIQRTTVADPSAREYLTRSLLEGSPGIQGRALRAFAKLQDQEVDAWLRTLCEAIIGGETPIDASRLRIDPAAVEAEPFQRAALEALRDVGDLRSLDVMRRARTRRSHSRQLRQLSFQAAEEMYWRLTRGLDAETYSAGAMPKR